MKKITLLFVVIFGLTTSYSQTQDQLRELDAYYQKALDEWHIPGMAVAIVNKDSILFSKGYGYANLNKRTKVDGNTLFAIASNSKAFTASAIAQLVEQGKLNWNDKVVDYLPYYRLYDDYTTQNMTIEDLLCHRNGLKTFSGDLLWFATNKSPEAIIAAQQYLKPVYGFRTQFGYSNISFLTAGKIIEQVTDTTWANYVSTHFLTPLNMNRTLTSTRQIKNTSNVATPYFYENGQNHELQWSNWDNVAPAGALISSVNDYANWLIMNLNKGRFNNTRFFSEPTFENLTTSRINFPVATNSEKVHFKSYGLGWFLQDYQGYKIVGHGGGYDGMISKSTFVPEKGIGVIVLTNSLNWVSSALVNKTLDVLLANNTDGKDWSAIYLNAKTKQDSIKKATQLAYDKLRGTLNPKHLPLQDYTGTYKDPAYGTTTISLKNNMLTMSMDETPMFKATLHHWNHHIFTFRFDTKLVSLPEGKLWFDLDENGIPYKLHIDVPNPDFDFTEFEFVKG